MDVAVKAYLDSLSSPVRRRDAATLIELMSRVSGEPPRMWGKIVGFGGYHYRYATGREGDAPAAAFAARKSATVVYLPDGVEAHTELMQRLGPHTTGVGCIYLKGLTTVALDVLESIVDRSYATLTADTYPKRA